MPGRLLLTLMMSTFLFSLLPLPTHILELTMVEGEGQYKGLGRVKVSRKPFLPAGAGGWLGWLSALCHTMRMECVQLRKWW